MIDANDLALRTLIAQLAEEMRRIRIDIHGLARNMDVLEAELIRNRVANNESRLQFARALKTIAAPIVMALVAAIAIKAGVLRLPVL
jgi:hypothetical protein